MMMGFWRLLLGLLSLFLLLGTILRALQPGQPDHLYSVIYGDRPWTLCCGVYLVSEGRQVAGRVQLPAVPQYRVLSDVSPSGSWRFANVDLGRRRAAYMVPQDGGEPLRLPDSVAQGWHYHWSPETDELYYLGWGDRQGTAFFKISPIERVPERLSGFQFGRVRSIHQQRLPILEGFTPWLLLFWGINALLIAALLKPRDLVSHEGIPPRRFRS
jgi:hypothetical protein